MATQGGTGKSGPSAPTIDVGEELDLFQGVQLLLRTAGHTEGCGTKPLVFDFQVAGIHEEHVSTHGGNKACLRPQRPVGLTAGFENVACAIVRGNDQGKLL